MTADIDENRDDPPAEDRAQAEVMAALWHRVDLELKGRIDRWLDQPLRKGTSAVDYPDWPAEAVFKNAVHLNKDLLSRTVRAAMAKGLSCKDAEDVGQNASIEALQQYRGDNGASFETYLRGILHFRVLDHLSARPDEASFDAGWDSGLLERDATEEATLYATTPVVPAWTAPGPARETQRFAQNIWHGQKARWETDPVTAAPIWEPAATDLPDLPIESVYRQGRWRRTYRIPLGLAFRAFGDPDGLTFVEAERLGMAESGMPVYQIAQQQGVPPKNIRDSLVNARKKRASRR